MARRSLRPELNRIRAWVRQGRTDAWIAHQLEVTVQQIQAFKREQGLEPGAEPDAAAGAPDFDDEIDLRAEDDALIAAELDAEAEAAAKAAEAEAAAKAAVAAAKAEKAEKAADGDADEDVDEDGKPKRRRARRGGRSSTRKRKAGTPLEGTFDHGEEGYGLWLDPAVQDDPVYAEYWAGHRPVEVTIEEDQIVIRRAGGEEADDAD
jgi:membrane protein involved in colicin uptake